MDFRGSTYGLFCACSGCRLTNPGEIRYVGLTSNTIEYRLRAHLNESRSKSTKPKDRWIRKHGAENIRSVLLEVTGSEDETRAAEVDWIFRLDTFKSERGLNLTRGGEGVWGLTMGEGTREKFRARTAKQMAVKHPRAKLNREDVVKILERLWMGETAFEIAEDYPVSSYTIQKISDGKNWPDIPRPVGPRQKPSGHLWRTWRTRKLVD